MGSSIRQSSIRKDAGELTLEDLEAAPVWTFCLDEEGTPGQTECTVRPLHPSAPLNLAEDSPIVVADFSGPNGRTWIGIVAMESEFRGPWCADATLFLPKPAGAFIEHPLLRTYNKVLMAHSPRVHLALPWEAHETRENIRTLMDLAYRALGVTAAELFPLRCRPRAAALTWPAEIAIDGFLRPVERRGEVFEVVV